MRITIFSAIITIATLLIAAGPIAANPDPPAWSTFASASASGVDLTPEVVDGNPGYFLHIDPGATLTIGTTNYQLNWIQSFFLVGATEQTEFVAPQGPVIDWWWEEKTKPGRIAGWVGEGQERVTPSSNGAVGKHLIYDALEFTQGSVLAGYHIGYGTGSASGWFTVSTAPNPVPEPSSFAGLAMGAVAALAAIRRRR